MTTPTPAGVFQPDILVVDIAALGYAAMYTPLGNMQHEGVATGAVHGAITSLFTRMAQRPNAMPLVLWDHKAHWRHELAPEYKSNRNVDPEKRRIRESYRAQVPLIQLLLSRLGVPQAACGGQEADDLAGVLCRELDPEWRLELVTGDTDWFQGLDHRSVWYSPVTGKGMTLERLCDPSTDHKDGHFLSTDEYLEAKALAGDTSDELDGIEKVGMKTATKLIRQHGSSIRDFWAGVDSGSILPKGVIESRVATADSRDLFKRNLRLMDWRLGPALDLECLSLTAGDPDLRGFEAEALDLGLKKLCGTARTGVQPWRAGWGPALSAVDSAFHHTKCPPVAPARPALRM